MKNYFVFKTIIILILIIPNIVFAGRGCCSHHGGECNCSVYGRSICCDGTTSPTCTCTPPKIYGCTDPNANNYNPKANTNSNCTYTIEGCIDQNASNYNPEANKDDGSCKYIINGCMDKDAINYDSQATNDNGSCEYIVGCMDYKAENYNADARRDDGSCRYNNNDTSNKNDSNKVETKELSDKISKEKEDKPTGIIPTLLFVGGTGYAVGSYKRRKKS